MVRFNKLQMISTVILMLFAQVLFAQRGDIQYFRHYDQRGVNVFETTKNDSTQFEGLKLRIGANFTQTYQNMNHSNTAKGLLTSTDGTIKGVENDAEPGVFTFTKNGNPVTNLSNIATDPNIWGGWKALQDAGTVNEKTVLFNNANALYQLSGGFPLAQANLNIDVQLADGVRVSLVSYMASHHHNEFWVKGGFFQIDKVGFLNSEFMNNLWKNLTLRVGHMEINYGDAHFRRSDGGNTIWNPFIENNLMDAFDTEIGGELYWQKNGIITMIGLTDGEIQGSVTRPNDRKPSLYGKFGFDKNISENFRARLTGSFYTTKSSISNNLYSADRTGSNYQFVLDNYAATVTGNFRSGRVNPGFTDNVTSFMINPFVKFRGFELFGTYEVAKGNTAVENGEIQYSDLAKPRIAAQKDRKFDQIALDVLYRFGKNEQFYIGGRYNKADGTIVTGTSTTQANISQGTRTDVSVKRTAVGAGWFITPNVLFKGEYVKQTYSGYSRENILNGGVFDGIVVQGIIGF